MANRRPIGSQSAANRHSSLKERYGLSSQHFNEQLLNMYQEWTHHMAWGFSLDVFGAATGTFDMGTRCELRAGDIYK